MLNEQFPTTVEWLKLLKKEKNLTSDYQLAKYLGLTQQAISGLMLGKNVMSDTTALKVAEGLGYSHLLLILSVMRERSKSEADTKIIDKVISESLKASVYILTGFLLASLYHVPSLFPVI